MNSQSGTYPPLNTLKPVAADVWIVDGPEIRFGPSLMKMRFPTRMTVIRLTDGRLVLHSPTAFTPELKSEMDAVGEVAFIIGPNRIHYWWIPDWKRAFPAATVYLAPGIRERAGSRIDFPAEPLSTESGYPWDAEIATLPVEGRYMTEVVFFHHASRTLVLTDLIENFDGGKLGFWSRLMAWAGGALAPHGSMPRDMRMTYGRPALKATVERMIAWRPERVILSHGNWFQEDGAGRLRKAFAWLLA